MIISFVDGTMLLLHSALFKQDFGASRLQELLNLLCFVFGDVFFNHLGRSFNKLLCLRASDERNTSKYATNLNQICAGKNALDFANDFGLDGRVDLVQFQRKLSLLSRLLLLTH